MKHTDLLRRGICAALSLILILAGCPLQVFAADVLLEVNQVEQLILQAGVSQTYSITVSEPIRTVLLIDALDVPQEGAGVSFEISGAAEYVNESFPLQEDGRKEIPVILPEGTTELTLTGYGAEFLCVLSFDIADCTTLPHEFTTVNTIAPTCSSTGYSGDKVCIWCDYTEAGTELPIVDHSNTLINEIIPTCTNSGYTGDTVCTGCDYLVPGEALEMLDHSWTTWETSIHPTYTKEGISQRSCTMCGLTEESPIPILVMVNPFTDVKEGAYYYDGVLWAARNEITTGRTPTTFVPADPCKRSEIVTFLCRAMSAESTAYGENPFADVKPDAYYYNSVLWAVKNHITSGTSATTFSPTEFCTRAQVVTFLWRASGSPVVSAQMPFIDVPSDSWYTPAVAWAYQSGITQGSNKENTTFSPKGVCTRGEIVTFLYRWIATEELG